MSSITEKVRAGDVRTVARLIRDIDDGMPEVRGVLKELYPHTGNAYVVGITGAPGVGKSTLVDQMIPLLRKEDKKIGIVAVDPSSPFSGGAILGDRIRMMRHSVDPDVFIRSMATRGHLGGLAKTTGEAITILEAAGKDLIIVETLGVGQDEVEVVKLADIVVVILTPGAGDEIQIFKAGIMEIADVFVLNKADSPDTEKLEKQLKAILQMGLKKDEITPVVKTVATEGTGVAQLIDILGNLKSRMAQPQLDVKKKKLISMMLKDIISDKIYREVAQNIQDSVWEEFIEKIHNREMDPYSVADEIIKKVRGD